MPITRSMMKCPIALSSLLLFLFIILHADQSSSQLFSRSDLAEKLDQTPAYIDMISHFRVDELLHHWGYEVESHTMKTQDGYFLKAHRILKALDKTQFRKRPTVFLQHGIHYNSIEWVISGPGKGLAYILAESGYDVWMGNLRGTIYSNRHVDRTWYSSEYWDFSMHQMAKYDLPAFIDYILRVTGESKLIYVGHSTGANLFYIMCALLPEYNSKIEAQFSLAPDAFLHETNTPSRTVGLLSQTFISKIMKFKHEMKLRKGINGLQSESLCANGEESKLCQLVLVTLWGSNILDIDEPRRTLLVSHIPDGTSRKTIEHYAQCALTREGVCKTVIYLCDVKMLRHTTEVMYTTSFFSTDKYAEYVDGFNISSGDLPEKQSPVEYNLTLVTVPVYLHYATNDRFSSEEEIHALHNLFPNSQGMFKIPNEDFYHLDYFWMTKMTHPFYQLLLEQMESHMKH